MIHKMKQHDATIAARWWLVTWIWRRYYNTHDGVEMTNVRRTTEVLADSQECAENVILCGWPTTFVAFEGVIPKTG